MTHTLRHALRVAILLLACAGSAAAQQVDWSTKALQSERSRAYDALHYRVAITLNLEEKSFAGEATITLTSLRDGLETVVLDAEEFTVTKVVTEWGEPLEFSQSEKTPPIIPRSSTRIRGPIGSTTGSRASTTPTTR